MTEHGAEQIARAAAARLANIDSDPRLEAEVCRQLNTSAGPAPNQYEPVSLAIAGVVISATTLAWTIYRDLRDDRKPTNTDALARRVRVQLAEQHPDTPTHDRNRIIDIVIEETVKHQP